MFRNLRLSTIGCAILAILVASMEAQQQPVAHHGRVRVHFIAAEEIDWDYTPLGRDEAMGHPFGEFEKNYVEAGPHRIGRIYKKVVYREYTDAKFNRLLTRSADEQYLGILGPVLYGEVADTIKIFFKNNASRPFSMHSHGVLYQKNSEGSGHNDGTDGDDKADDAVQPGGHSGMRGIALLLDLLKHLSRLSKAPKFRGRQGPHWRQ